MVADDSDEESTDDKKDEVEDGVENGAPHLVVWMAVPSWWSSLFIEHLHLHFSLPNTW